MTTQTANAITTKSHALDLRALWRGLIATDDRWVGTAARLALGLVILPHGLQKTLGLFGGYGFEGTMGFLTETVGVPWIVGAMVIAIESVGALALIVGGTARLAAAGIACVMTGAVLTTHVPNGFFMNWTGTQAGEGFEFHLLALGLAAVVLLAGAGRGSIDHWIAGRAPRG